MTVSVYVKARAHGAVVTLTKKTEGEEGHNITNDDIVLGAWAERDFHLEDGQSINVVEPATAEVAEEVAATTAPDADGFAAGEKAADDAALATNTPLGGQGSDVVDANNDGRDDNNGKFVRKPR